MKHVMVVAAVAVAFGCGGGQEKPKIHEAENSRAEDVGAAVTASNETSWGTALNFVIAALDEAGTRFDEDSREWEIYYDARYDNYHVAYKRRATWSVSGHYYGPRPFVGTTNEAARVMTPELEYVGGWEYGDLKELEEMP